MLMSTTLGHGDTCRLIAHPTPSTSHYNLYLSPHPGPGPALGWKVAKNPSWQDLGVCTCSLFHICL